MQQYITKQMNNKIKIVLSKKKTKQWVEKKTELKSYVS